MAILFLVAFIFMVVQSFLTYRQAKDFTKTYSEMKKYGLVSTGKERRYLTQGRILILACSQDGIITKAKEMKGRTVFATFKDIDEYVGMSVNELEDIAEKENEEIKKDIRRNNKQQSALSQAVGGLVDYFENKEEYDEEYGVPAV